MKKILCLLPVMAILFLAGCSNSDEEVARNFNVTVSLIAKDGITISDINDLEVTAVNLTTSKEQTASPADGKLPFHYQQENMISEPQEYTKDKR